MNHLLKRTFSLLLALVMCLSLAPILPAVTSAAEIEMFATFELGSNGTASHSDGSSKTTYTETDGEYTLSVTSGTNFYTGACDAKGNSCFKLGSSKKVGSFQFTVPDDVTEVVISVAKYKTNTTKITVNGTAYTLSKNSDNGEYDEITVDTTSTKTVSFTTVSGGVRAMVNTIVFNGASSDEGGDSECTHANTTTTTVNATCTEAGSTTVTCDDCGETVSTTPIDATGHSYVDGTCSSCGAAEPAGYVLTDLANITSTQNVIITMSKDGTVWALSSANGTSAAPKAVVVTVENNVVTGNYDNIYWNIVNDNGSLTIYPAGDTSKWLYCTSTNNGVRVGTNANKAFTVDASSGYLKNTATSRYLGVYTTTPDWRCYTNTTGNTAGQTLAFYVLNEGTVECQHTKTEQIAAVAATCTTAGNTAGVKCTDCGIVIEGGEIVPALDHSWNEGEVTTAATCTEEGKKTYTCTREDCGKTKTEAIAATGHSYEEGVCTVCGTEKPVGLDGEYYIAAKRSSGNYFYMTNDLGEASTKRYQAVDSGLTELPALIVPSAADAEKVFMLSMNDDGTYIIGAGADSFLGWTSGNSGALVAADAAKKLTIEQNTQTGTCQISFVNGEDTRVLSLNNTTGNDYFAFYAGTQVNDLVLIPVKNCVHTDADSNKACDVCGKTVVAQVGTAVYTDVADAIAAAGNGGYVKLTGPVTADVELKQNLYLDLAGYSWDGTITTGSYTFYGMDSATDDYDCSNGYGTVKVSGNVAVHHKTTVEQVGFIRRYLTYTESDGSLSFHRIYLGITHMSLRPGVKGVGYKATFRADAKAQELLNTTDAFGYNLWLFDDDGTKLATSKGLAKSEFAKQTITLRLQNFNLAYGDHEIYANVYLKLTDGTVITSSDYYYTLQQMVERINTDLETNSGAYSETQMTALQAMLKGAAATASWTISNIMNWQAPAAQ